MQLTHLITDVQSLDQHLIHKVSSAVNTSLTLRNWLIGAYIVEYKQNDSDRAEYGKKLIPTIAKSLQIKGLSTSVLWSCRSFYQTCPSILQTLSGVFKNISHTLSLPILQTASGVSLATKQIGQTLSDESPSTPRPSHPPRLPHQGNPTTHPSKQQP